MLRKTNGTFTAEGLKGNRFACGHTANKTSFAPGAVPHNFAGIGVPRVVESNRDGTQVVVCTDEQAPRTSRGRTYISRKRTSYARYLIKPPKELVVYHNDGNPLNNAKENLEVITRAELLRRNLQKRLG